MVSHWQQQQPLGRPHTNRERYVRVCVCFLFVFVFIRISIVILWPARMRERAIEGASRKAAATQKLQNGGLRNDVAWEQLLLLLPLAATCCCSYSFCRQKMSVAFCGFVSGFRFAFCLRFRTHRSQRTAAPAPLRLPPAAPFTCVALQA